MSYESQTKTDHGRVVTSGGWIALTVGSLAMCAIEGRLVPWAAFLVSWLVILPAAFIMARYKRAWYAWLDFTGLVLLCLASGFTQLFTSLLRQPFSVASFAYAIVMVSLWYWLIRMPRSQRYPETPPEASHVIHHHVVYGQYPVTQAYPEPVVSATPKVIPGRVVPVLEPSVARATDARQYLKRTVRKLWPYNLKRSRSPEMGRSGSFTAVRGVTSLPKSP